MSLKDTLSAIGIQVTYANEEQDADVPAVTPAPAEPVLEERESLDQMKERLLNNIRERNTISGGVNETGMTFGDADTSATMEAQSETVVQSLGRAFRSTNAGAGLYQYVKRKNNIPADRDFRLSTHWNELEMDKIPIEYWDDFNDVESMDEALMLKAQINQELDDMAILGKQGVQGMAALGAAGLFDIDAPIMLASGGLGAAAKATRIGKIAASARNAAVAASVVEGVNVYTRPTHSVSDVVVAGTYGLAFGGLAGTFGKTKYRNALENQADEAGGPLGVGAAQNPNARIYTSMNPQRYSTVDELVDAAGRWNKQSGFSYKLGSGNTLADKFHEILQKSPLKTDYDRMANSPSNTAKWFAFEGLESPAGKVRNNRTMANQREAYHKQISSLAIPEYNRAFNDWGQGQGINHWQRVWDGQHADTFGKAVMSELFSRRYGEAVTEALDPAIKRAADAIEAAGQRAFEIARGVGDELPIKGFENITYKRGYFPLIWRGDKIRKAFASFGEDKVHGLLARSYGDVLGVDQATATKLAKAITRRAIAKEEGFDMNVQNMLNADGREFLKQALVDNGIGNKEADRIINGLGVKVEERGTPSFAKGRTEIDIRYNEDGLSLMDLLETDLQRSFSKYSRELSGKAAMARKGIGSRAEWSRLKDAMKKEDPSLDDEYLDGIYSYFGGGPLAGGVNPYARRAMQLTNLSLLNGLGLTQLAETGAIIAASGWEAFMKTAPDVIKDALGKPTSGSAKRLLDELRPLLGNVGDEHLIFRDDYALDIHRGFTGDESKMLQTFDHALAQGQRLQGYTSFFYQVRQMQQRIAVTSMANKVMKALKENDATFVQRMDDIGMTEDLQAYIGKKLKDGTIEFTEDGVLDRMGLANWDPKMAEEFSLAINRHTDQVLQRAMAGESSVWMHQSVGAMFMHLKSFPVLAMQKQFVRNARLMDNVTAMTFMYGLGTAGLVYMAREVASGREDQKLSPMEIAKGAFGLSNMTGWLPMWTDPLAEMLGMNNLKFQDYGPRGVTDGVLAVPPVIPTINRIAHIPGAILDATNGDMSNSSLYALQAIPIIGNAYGFNWMFNQLKN